MKQEFESIELIKNDKDGQFELTFNGYKAFIVFKETPQKISLIHTESPEELKGTGAAAALVEKTLLFIEKSQKTLMPYCPFVFAYIKKHPEWKRIVDPTFPSYDSI